MSVEVTGPQGVPDLRLHFLDRWREGGKWDTASVTERFALPWNQHQPIRMSELRPERYWHLNHLRQADLWYVAAPMVDVVMSMAKRLPGDVRPHELDIDWPLGERAGLVVFGQPIKGTDSRVPNHTVDTHAILFGPTLMAANPAIGRLHDEACVSVSSYTFRRWEDGLEPDLLEMAMSLGEMPKPIDGTHQRNDKGEHAFMGRGAFWAPLGRSDWPLLDRLNEPIDTEPVEGFHDSLDQSAEEDRRLLAALLLVASQPRLAEHLDHFPDRGTARRSKRAKVESKVRVIRLRRPKEASDDEPTGEHRDWSCHWMVQAHPRWQPCGPGRSQRKLITVAAHIKGDTTKPFKEPPEATVYGLVR